MPTSGTHITVVERVANSSIQMKELLGDPFADPDTQEGTKMRFAKLGSAGPDIFYAMADYGGDLQDLEDFLIKVAGTFDAIGELMGKVGRYVDGIESEITLGISDSLHETFGLITGVVNEGVMALIVGPLGMNFWPIFEAARQKDQPREKWYWADYLHYIKSGKFVLKLISNARASGNENLIAFAYGYLTHYVTDVVGHPYVNQVVQGPWRTYWQRHHVVENFIDAYVWDRWHVSNLPPAPPSTEEAPLDTLVGIPNSVGDGAPVTQSRLNDHVNIGSISLGDPVDDLVQAVVDQINEGLFDIGVANNISPAPSTDADFIAWTKLVSETIRQVYDQKAGHRVPQNLANTIIPGIPPSPDGYPTAEDVGGAYGVFRLVLRVTTEEKVKEPQPPDIVGDISAAVNKLIQDIQNDLNSVPPLPNINTSGSFSWDSLWDAIKKIAEWIGETLAAVGKTVFDFIRDTINTVGTAVSDVIKYALYLINKALFALFNAFRDVLVYAGYATPYNTRLSIDMGGGHSTEALWRSPGNSSKENYPMEEIAIERDYISSSYAPATPPREQTDSVSPSGSLYIEHPGFTFVAPYQGAGLTPDVFLEGAAGPQDMFHPSGPQAAIRGNPDSRWNPPSIDVIYKNFGGAIQNCIKAINLSENNFPLDSTLPDYNLDGDRSYAWPCWDVTDPEPVGGGNPPVTQTPLRPEPTINDSSVYEAMASVVPVSH